MEAGARSKSDTPVPPPKFGNLARSLIVGVGLAYGATLALTHAGLKLPIALAISSIFPLADTAYEYIRRRHLGAIDLLSLLGIAVGVGLSLHTGDPRFALAKESVLTGVIGLVFFASLLAPKPAIFFLARETTDTPNIYEERWLDSSYFRATLRGMTVLWGAGLVLESTLRIVAAFTLDPSLTLLVSPGIAVVTLAILIRWTLAWAKRASARGAAMAAASSE